MTDAELRAKAEAAAVSADWYTADELEMHSGGHDLPGMDAAYIAAASPLVVLALITRVENAEAAAITSRDLANRAFAMAWEHDSEECESGCREGMAEIRTALNALGDAS